MTIQPTNYDPLPYPADEQERRDFLEEKYGKDNVWDYKEVGEHFEITGFAAPYCSAWRKSDGLLGVLEFCHHPRFYFDFRSSGLEIVNV